MPYMGRRLKKIDKHKIYVTLRISVGLFSNLHPNRALMNPTLAEPRFQDTQTSIINPQVDVEKPPKLNALKHGLRSAAILLPDDDGQEFERLRRDLFLTYRPRTGDEAACVEAMAGHHWRIARCRRWQAVYDAQTDALLTGDPHGLAGHVCESDPRRWMHKSMDCTLQESRLDRLMCRTRDKLLLLQKLRRSNQIAGAVDPEPDWLAPENPMHGEAGTGGHPAIGQNRPPAAGSRTKPPLPESCSSDGEIPISDERTVTPPALLHTALAADTDVPLADGPKRPRHESVGVSHGHAASHAAAAALRPHRSAEREPRRAAVPVVGPQRPAAAGSFALPAAPGGLFSSAQSA
jgi:hypothetical protein